MSEYNLVAYLAAQGRELEEHKFYLSEQAGHNVGIRAAINDWLSSGHAERFHNAYIAHLDDISKVCEHKCGSVEDCKGRGKCPLSLEIIHEVLED